MPNQNSDVPPGWIGGFAESNPAFAYPDPNLTSLPMLDNMANIERIKRQQRVHWPEFSWETVKGDPNFRCFERFAYNISSIGYDDAGRIWSIICPQQGVCATDIGCLNVEVTVTGQRGWVNEPDRDLAADMTVEGKIWLSPSSHQKWWVQKAWELFAKSSLPFPSDKANAIQVSTHKVGNPEQPIFPLYTGQSPLFEAPKFAKHPRAWATGYIEVEIGPVVTHNHPVVDAFNQKLIDIFNIFSGNMLLNGNVLTWNLWFTAPEGVNTVAWRTHAERWRKSIDADHGCHKSGNPRYADGSPFKASENIVDELVDEISEIVERLL